MAFFIFVFTSEQFSCNHCLMFSNPCIVSRDSKYSTLGFPCIVSRISYYSFEILFTAMKNKQYKIVLVLLQNGHQYTVIAFVHLTLTAIYSKQCYQKKSKSKTKRNIVHDKKNYYLELFKNEIACYNHCTLCYIYLTYGLA